MAVTSNPGPCHCSTCRGSLQLPAQQGRPAAYPHEIEERPDEVPVVAPPAPVLALPERRAAKVARPPLSASERIAQIEARTDIGAGMKRMQIGNIMRRMESK